MKLPEVEVAAAEPQALATLNAHLATLAAGRRVDWMLRHLPEHQVLSSSFGAQAAAMLHLVTQRRPAIAVILIDTGYLFAETYRFADALCERLRLNLQVYRPPLGAAWLEARHGRLWEQGLEGIERYNRLAKVEPMQRALDELGARSWYSGLRRAQSGSRAHTDFLELRKGRWKTHPIADWSDRDVGQYLAHHDLPYHPLWDKGYVSIGDVHTTHPLAAGMSLDDTRFFGLKRECGLHLEV